MMEKKMETTIVYLGYIGFLLIHQAVTWELTCPKCPTNVHDDFPCWPHPNVAEAEGQ